MFDRLIVLSLPLAVLFGGVLGADTAAANQFQVGAAKVNLAPEPEQYGGIWEQDYAKCANLSENFLTRQGTPEQFQMEVDHLATAGSPWPENPNCLYMGGYGIGPMNPITSFDTEYGMWVRSIAISDGTTEGTTVLTVLDAEGYFWNYASKCEGNELPCGARALSEHISAERGIPADNFVFSATHAHTGMDLIGGWGFVPGWYMQQVSDAILESVDKALASMQAATIEIGEERAREHNRERRDTYRSAEEQQLTWLRARDLDGRVIATMAAYAAHPTSVGTNGGVAHPDWPGVFVKEIEQRDGGLGLLFMTGLGNMSSSGGLDIGSRLAALIPEPAAAKQRGRDRKLPQATGGTALEYAPLKMKRSVWNHPVTNVPLTGLGVPGFFDREFNPAPAQVQTGPNPEQAPCLSGSPYSVEVAVTAMRIGDQFALTTGPGELFSNLTNTIKEKSGALVTMPLAQSNDALGYMPQDFELNMVGQQGLGFGVSGVLFVNYEDSYSIDHCFGDMALETAIQLQGELRAQD